MPSKRKNAVGQPSVYRGSCKVPEVFSFEVRPLSDNPREAHLCERFNRNREFYNQITHDIRVLNPRIVDAVYRLVAVQHKEYEILSQSDNVGIRKCLLRDLLFMAYFNDAVYQSNREAVQRFLGLYNLLPPDVCDDEMTWYWFIVQFNFIQRNRFVREGFHQLLGRLPGIKSRPHRTGLYGFLNNRLELLEGYPQIEDFSLLRDGFPEKPFPVEGRCANKRLDFIKKKLKNPEFFSHENNGLFGDVKRLERNTSRKQLRLSADDCVANHELKMDVDISEYFLGMFAAHIQPPTPPIFKLVIIDVDSKTMDNINSKVIRNLRAKGLANSLGFIKKNSFDVCHFSDFIESIMQAVRAGLPTLSDEYYRRIRTDLSSKRQFFIDDYSRLEQRRKAASGFESVRALAYCYSCLREFQYGLAPEQLGPIRDITARCLSLSYLARKVYNAEKTEHARHNKWFALAKQVVNYLKHKRQHFLVAVGTPVEVEEENKYSTHAFYVAFKYIGGNQYQIIITNGGGRSVRNFHMQSDEIDPKDWKKYYYAAFEPILIDDASIEEILVHYIYRLIVTEYTPCATGETDRVYGNDTDGNILANIYLREATGSEEFFYGYQSVEKYCGIQIRRFKRCDLDSSFLVQLTGNCTVHNYRNSLVPLFGMDELYFGLFENTLMHGLDKMITEFKHDKQGPSPLRVHPTFFDEGGSKEEHCRRDFSERRFAF